MRSYSENDEKESDFLRWIANRLEHLRFEKVRPDVIRIIAEKIEKDAIRMHDVVVLDSVYLNMKRDYAERKEYTYMIRLLKLCDDMRSMLNSGFASKNLKAWKALHTKKKAVKPPLGLSPRKVADKNRADQIVDAMLRYAEVDKLIPYSWVQELQERLK